MATVRWEPTAAKIAQVSTITIGGTWTGSDTASATINGNSVTVTVGTGTSTANVAEALANAINANSKTDNLQSDETRNTGGQTIPEFKEVVATYDSGSTFTVTTIASLLGVPFTMVVSKSSASGTIGIAETVSATGPNHWDNIYNWDGAAVPMTDDDVVFANTDVSALYGLPNGSLNPDLMRVEASFTGRIGLPPINRNNPSAAYSEYRQRYLVMDNNGADVDGVLIIGEGQGQGSPMLNIDWQLGVSDVFVYSTGTPSNNLRDRALNLQLDGDCNVTIQKGSVALGPEVGDTCDLGTVTVGYVTNPQNDVQLTIGPDASLASQTLSMTGGQVTVYGVLTSSTINQKGGTLRLSSYVSHTVTTYDGTGGELHFDGPRTITNFSTAGTRVRLSSFAVTLTNCTFSKGFDYVDPNKKTTFTNGIDFYRCGVEDGALVYGSHYTLTPSTI